MFGRFCSTLGRRTCPRECGVESVPCGPHRRGIHTSERWIADISVCHLPHNRLGTAICAIYGHIVQVPQSRIYRDPPLRIVRCQCTLLSPALTANLSLSSSTCFLLPRTLQAQTNWQERQAVRPAIAASGRLSHAELRDPHAAGSAGLGVPRNRAAVGAVAAMPAVHTVGCFGGPRLESVGPAEMVFEFRGVFGFRMLPEERRMYSKAVKLVCWYLYIPSRALVDGTP